MGVGASATGALNPRARPGPDHGAMSLEILSRIDSFELKADGDQSGLIEGYASVWGEKDRGDDIVLRGAFTKSLRELREGTRRYIPMLHGHFQQGVPVGVWTDFAEDSRGLKVKGRLVLEDGPARQLYGVLKLGAQYGISIGYKTAKYEFDELAKVRKLLELDLYEISLVPIPMLDPARVTSVKSMGGGEDHSALIRDIRASTDAVDLMVIREEAARLRREIENG
jgi:uncharacterized protein